MKLIFLFSLLICMNFATKLSAETEVRDAVEFQGIKKTIKIQASWFPPIQDAVERFHQTGQDLECFRILLAETRDNIYVSFLPFPDVEIFEDGSQTVSGPKAHCGTARTYKYTLFGKFIK